MVKHEKLHEYYSRALGEFLDKKGYDLACITTDNKILLQDDGQVVRFNGVLFICPLCIQQLFLKNYLKKSVTDYLSLDHVPPKSVGGTFTVPVCNRCNSNCGSTIDKALLEFVNFHLFIEETPKVKMPATITFGNDKFLRVQMEFMKMNNKTIGVTLPVLKGNLLSAFQQHLKSDQPFSFSVKRLNNYNAGLGLVKIAYLVMFNYFGYEFILSKNAERIRDILFQRMQHPSESLGILNIPAYSKLGISLLLQPESAECYVCSFSLHEQKSGKKQEFMIAMPGPGEEGWEKYLNLSTITEGEDVSGFFISSPPLEKDLFFAYSGYWESKHG